MGGFIEKRIADKKSSIPFDQEMATKLYNGLKKARLLPYKCSPSKWPEQFRMLRSIATELEIKSVVEWYVDNVKDDYTPKVQSAKTFRSNFPRIVAAMNRNGNPLGFQGMEVSPQASKFATRIDLAWPGTELQQLPAFIQVGLSSYELFRTAILKLFYKLKQQSMEKTQARKYGVSSEDWQDTKLVQYIIDSMPSAHDVILSYLRAAHWLAWNSPNWNGNLMSMSFRPETNRFQQMMARLVAERRLDGSDWIRIWKQIQEIMDAG